MQDSTFYQMRARAIKTPDVYRLSVSVMEVVELEMHIVLGDPP
jgi:hypothetical protein